MDQLQRASAREVTMPQSWFSTVVAIGRKVHYWLSQNNLISLFTVNSMWLVFSPSSFLL